MTSRKAGFSLIEVALAMAVLTLLLLGLAASTAGSVQLTEVAQERRAALNKAEAVLARLLAHPSLSGTWSKDGKPRQSTAERLAGNPEITTGPGYTYSFMTDPSDPTIPTLQPLGEALPPERVFQDLGASGTFIIHAYRFEPTNNTFQLWDASTALFPWDEADFYRIKVRIEWQPAARRRRPGDTAMTPAFVEVESVYYRPRQLQ